MSPLEQFDDQRVAQVIGDCSMFLKLFPRLVSHTIIIVVVFNTIDQILQQYAWATFTYIQHKDREMNTADYY